MARKVKVNGKTLTVSDVNGVYCYRCKTFFNSRKWAFNRSAPVQCNKCQRKDYHLVKLRSRRRKK